MLSQSAFNRKHAFKTGLKTFATFAPRLPLVRKTKGDEVNVTARAVSLGKRKAMRSGRDDQALFRGYKSAADELCRFSGDRCRSRRQGSKGAGSSRPGCYSSA